MVLPIDEHRERILSHIAAQYVIFAARNLPTRSSAYTLACQESRAPFMDSLLAETVASLSSPVTIIHGETGCGKSSRVPAMLLESLGDDARMFVSQPRRIAATTLMRRVRGDLGKRVGLRLGGGVRDESNETRLWYCTAGYLQLIAAHQPDELKRCTHLIIDEVHERSVDTDLLCYFMRGIIRDTPGLKLVLMSATVCTADYQEYFDVKDDPIFVGVRRFPLTINYLEDLPSVKPSLPSLITKPAAKLLGKLPGLGVPPRQPKTELINEQHLLAFHLARAVGKPGKSVLIFVSGIKDIDDIARRFEELPPAAAGQHHYRIIAIHSDVPFDNQMEAFEESYSVVLACIVLPSPLISPFLGLDPTPTRLGLRLRAVHKRCLFVLRGTLNLGCLEQPQAPIVDGCIFFLCANLSC